MQDEAQRKTKQIERLERHAKQQANEVAKANSIIKQLQKDLKAAQNKVCIFSLYILNNFFCLYHTL